LEFLTESKKTRLGALLQAYRAAVNFFIKSLWQTPGCLDGKTLARLPKGRTRLSERFKSAAQKQALEIVSSTKKAAWATGVVAGLPYFKGPAILDAKFVSVEDGKGSFDLIIKISSLTKGQRIVIPTRHTEVTRKWLAKPLAKLVQGCSLSEDSLVLWVDLPNLPDKVEGECLGMDIGVNKLLSTSDGQHFGRDFKAIRDKIRRRKLGSKGRARAHREREHFINRTLNLLPWSTMRVLGIEDLSDMKRGKGKRGKSFRKAMAPWTYRQVLNRASHKAQENRVLLVAVNPANTSRTCPVCKMVSKLSRKGEQFKCISCLHEEDADTVGALEILDRTLRFLGSLASPRPKMSFTSHPDF
jgi:IS605 OrfB family transposase